MLTLVASYFFFSPTQCYAYNYELPYDTTNWITLKDAHRSVGSLKLIRTSKLRLLAEPLIQSMEHSEDSLTRVMTTTEFPLCCSASPDSRSHNAAQLPVSQKNWNCREKSKASFFLIWRCDERIPSWFFLFKFSSIYWRAKLTTRLIRTYDFLTKGLYILYIYISPSSTILRTDVTKLPGENGI